MLISICIPTLNRETYLIQALLSIFEWRESKYNFEICISNNLSNESYENVEDLIEEKKCSGWNIKYIKQTTRLDIDRNMHFVIDMASSEYVFLLGDDDFFIPEQFPDLLSLVSKLAPDLAIFNAHIVDSQSNFIGRHFDIEPTIFKNVKEAFLKLRDKGTFGSILIKKEHLKDFYIKCLYGSSHAYGGYWFSILNDKYDNAVITVPDFPCVSLRMAEKSYNHEIVYYRDIPFEAAVYSRWLKPGEPQVLNSIYYKKYLSKITSFSFVISLLDKGISFKDIYKINPAISSSLRFRVVFFLSKILYSFGLYQILRQFKKNLKRLYRLIKR